MFLLKYRHKWEVAVNVDSVLVLSISVWLIRASERAPKGPWHAQHLCASAGCSSSLRSGFVWLFVSPKSLFSSLECARALLASGHEQRSVLMKEYSFWSGSCWGDLEINQSESLQNSWGLCGAAGNYPGCHPEVPFSSGPQRC